MYIKITEEGVVVGEASFPSNGRILNEWGAKVGDTLTKDADGNYNGFTSPNKTRVKPGEVMALLGSVAYAKLYRAAYPQGNKPEDDIALYFLEQAKFPYSSDGLIEVTDPEISSALTYFRDHTPPYITQEDMDRVLMGVSNE